MKRYWWYVMAVTALTLATFADEISGWSALIFVIPFNIALYFIPVWLVVKLVQWIRRKPEPQAAPIPEVVDESIYDVPPAMTRK